MKMLALLLVLVSIPSPGGSLEDATGLYSRGEYRQAVNLLLQLKKEAPDNADVRLWLGKSYLKIRNWDDAVREIEKATELQPGNAEYHLWLGRACGARAEHSVFFKAINWARRVVRAFETARKLSPANLDVRFDLLDFYLAAPGIVGGGKDKADTEVQAIARLDPRKGYTARSIVLSKDKKWDLAQHELIKATIDYPNDASAYKDAADYLLDHGDYAGALQYAKKALALNSESKRSRLILAAAQTQLRSDLDSSIQILTYLASGPLTDGDPGFEEVYYWLGQSYLAKGDKTKAAEALASALKFNPDHKKSKELISRLR